MFRDREQAGKSLALALRRFHGQGVVVVGLPRGGVICAVEVARELHAPLDLMLPRKIAAPFDPEFAIASISEDGTLLCDPRQLQRWKISRGYLLEAAAAQMQEIKRRSEALRGGLPRQELKGKTVILVDDGLATGATMEAAVHTARIRQAESVVVAVPVGPPSTVERLRGVADEVVCLEVAADFRAISEFYHWFAQVSEAEVRAAMRSVAIFPAV